MSKPFFGIGLAAAVFLAAIAITVSRGPVAAYARTAQDEVQEANPIVSTEVSISNTEARLRLEWTDGSALTVALNGGRALVDGRDVGEYAPGDALDQSWRALLRAAIDTEPEELPVLLSAWPPPAGTPGESIAEALAAHIAEASPAAPAAPARTAEAGDTVERLEARVQALERLLRELGSDASAGSFATPADGDGNVARPSPPVRGSRAVRRIADGFAGLISTLVAYGLLLAIGCTLVYFGRRYVEGIADTVRHATIRSGLVGFAASILVVPAFAIGVIALTITVIGIPLLLVWVPVFPLAVVAASALGFIAVAHAAGEAMAERRLYGAEWLKANSYYFIATGLALLAAAFVAASVALMAGPWLDFARVILVGTGFVVIWIALTLGLGAVLLSRCGTRPVTRSAELELSLPFED